MSFEDHSADEIRRRLCKTVNYLQDSQVTVEGLCVYGTPWTGDRYSPASAFTLPYSQLHDTVWTHIPSDTQILVTHSPPEDVMDDHGRIGCRQLRNAVFERIR